MPEQKSFGERLKTLRKKSGLTQEKLAEKMGVHLNTIWAWENNINRGPDTLQLTTICEILQCNEKELLNDTPEEEKWIVEVKFADNKKEVFDLAKGLPCIAQITTDQNGALIHIAGSYGVFGDDKQFNSLISQLKKARALVLQNGKAIGSIQ